MLNLTIIRGMQIRTAMRYSLTLIRMGNIKKFINNKSWRWCGEKGTLLYCCGECKFIQPQWRTVWGFLKKLNTELPYDLAIQLLGIYPEKTIIRKYSKMFFAALFTIVNTWKQLKCSSREEWIKNMRHIYTMNTTQP